MLRTRLFPLSSSFCVYAFNRPSGRAPTIPCLPSCAALARQDQLLQCLLPSIGRPGGNRTPNLRFWRPPLCQLSYWPVAPNPLGRVETVRCATDHLTYGPGTTELVRTPYSIIFATTPAPTVLPPSRIAKRSPSSMAIGAIRSTIICTLSPGITISVPSGSSTAPVTSVVRK